MPFPSDAQAPFFDAKLKAMKSEAQELQAHIAQLEGSLGSQGQRELRPEALQDTLQHHKALFGRCAARLQVQHARIEARLCTREEAPPHLRGSIATLERKHRHT